MHYWQVAGASRTAFGSSAAARSLRRNQQNHAGRDHFAVGAMGSVEMHPGGHFAAAIEQGQPMRPGSATHDPLHTR